MTPREFSGWVPAETHTHYAADGETVTGYTVVEREPRIDDADRAELLALARFDAEVCRCGFHPSLTDDPANDWKVETRQCPVCSGHAVQSRVDNEADSRVPHDAPPTIPRPSDGRHTWMRLVTPDQVANQKGGDRGDKA